MVAASPFSLCSRTWLYPTHSGSFYLYSGTRLNCQFGFFLRVWLETGSTALSTGHMFGAPALTMWLMPATPTLSVSSLSGLPVSPGSGCSALPSDKAASSRFMKVGFFSKQHGCGGMIEVYPVARSTWSRTFQWQIWLLLWRFSSWFCSAPLCTVIFLLVMAKIRKVIENHD